VRTTSTPGRFCIAALAAAAALMCGGSLAQRVMPATDTVEFASGRILVMPHAGLPERALARIVKDSGGTGSRRIGQSPLRIVELPRGLEMQAVATLKRNPHIEFAELDRRVAPAAAPNDPYFGSSWHLAKINASTAWDSSTGSGVTVAVLDTGVDAAHPDLSSRIVPGWNFHDNNSNTSDVHGHGSAVAGAAAATMNNAIGVAAIAGQARIMPIRIADANAYAYWSTVAQGLTWAADNGARVANISYVGVAGSSAVQSAAQYMKNKGGLVVVCAGNNNRDEGIAPTTAMIPVSATDENDLKTSFSSWGGFVAMSAPGINVWTTQRGGTYGQWWGTSIASPVTAGVVALMMARKPTLSAAQVESLLYASAVDLGASGRDPVFGHGRVDAAAALRAVDGATASTTDTQAPTVSLASPSGGSTVSGLVSVGVNASDDTGVSRVDLLVNGAVVASDTSAPFAFSWDSTQISNGSTTLSLRASDAAGNTATSAGVVVTVSNVAVADTSAPVLRISNPVDGSVVSGNVGIRVEASDDSGAAAISQTLLINGTRVASATGGSLSFNWNTRKVKPGSYVIQAVAVDAAGNRSSQSVTVTR
jgi:thermitase